MAAKVLAPVVGDVLDVAATVEQVIASQLPQFIAVAAYRKVVAPDSPDTPPAAAARTAKGPDHQGLSFIAGAGFEPATFGL